MTLQTLNNPIGWPGLAVQGGSAPSGAGAGNTINGAGVYDATVFCAEGDMAISHVGLKCQSATGSPTADIRIETVDSSGNPSGTLWATSTNFVTGTLNTTFTVFALGATANIPKGSLFAVKVLYNSGTSFVINTISGVLPQKGLPYSVFSTGPTKSAATGKILALGSSSTTFYFAPSFYPASGTAQNAFNNTNSAKKAVRFQVPFVCRAVGLRYYAGTATGDFNALMMDDSGAELSSSSTAFLGAQASNLATGLLDCFFDSPVILSPATWYKAAIQPAGATNCNFYTASMQAAAHRSGWPGGNNFYLSSLASGTWTDDTSSVPFMDILIDQFDDGVSGFPASRAKLGM